MREEGERHSKTRADGSSRPEVLEGDGEDVTTKQREGSRPGTAAGFAVVVGVRRKEVEGGRDVGSPCDKMGFVVDDQVRWVDVRVRVRRLKVRRYLDRFRTGDR